jgi:hypothetical protein
MSIQTIEKPIATKIRKLESLPQANDFEKIVNLINSLVNNKNHTHASVQKQLDVHDREVSYYLNAAKQFRLLAVSTGENNTHYYELTEEMKMVLTKSKKTQMLYFIRKIMSNDICKHIVNTYLEKGYYLTNSEVTDYIKTKHAYLSLSENTTQRRISTLFSWSKWTIEHFQYIY